MKYVFSWSVASSSDADAAAANVAAPKRSVKGKSRMIAMNYARRLAGIGVGRSPITERAARGAGAQ